MTAAYILLAPVRFFQAWGRVVRTIDRETAERKAKRLCIHCGEKPVAEPGHTCFECLAWDAAI